RLVADLLHPRPARALRHADDVVADLALHEPFDVTGDVVHREAGDGTADEVLPGGDGDVLPVGRRCRAAGLRDGVGHHQRVIGEGVEGALQDVDGARVPLLDLPEVDVVDAGQSPGGGGDGDLDGALDGLGLGVRD